MSNNNVNVNLFSESCLHIKPKWNRTVGSKTVNQTVELVYRYTPKRQVLASELMSLKSDSTGQEWSYDQGLNWDLFSWTADS